MEEFFGMLIAACLAVAALLGTVLVFRLMWTAFVWAWERT